MNCIRGNHETTSRNFFSALILFFPAIALAVLVIATPFVAQILQCCFRNDFSAPEGVNATLKTFVNGSPTEVEIVIGERNISSSLAQLQKLDLARERRRRINRKIVICLAAGQAKAFAKLRTMSSKETSQQIIDDFTHSRDSCIGKLKDTVEDLKDFMKEKYGGVDILVNNAGIAFTLDSTEHV